MAPRGCTPSRKSTKFFQNRERAGSLPGFTYIEILISLFLVSVILIVLDSVTQTFMLMRQEQFRSLALAVASHEIEGVRGAGYSALPESGSFTDSSLNDLPSGAGSLTVSAFNPGTKEVVVTVSWLDPQTTTTKSVSLDTLVTQLGGLP